MIPGGDPAPPRGVGKDCTSCRLLGFGILTGTGFYTIYSALYAPDASSSPLSSSSSTGTARATSNTAAHSTAVTSHVRKDVVAGQKIPLGLNTRGFGQHNGMGRGLLAGFGALLVVAGVARGMGVTHYDVVDWGKRRFGSITPDASSSTV